MSEYKYRVNLFYSYCHKDESYRKRMETALAPLRANGFLIEWSDRKTIAGTPLSPQIISKLNSSDLVVCLVSPDFLASEPCIDEWRRARKNAGETGQRLVPIILRPCAWENSYNMKDYLALPDDGLPISKWEDQDAAWQDVYEQIKGVLEDIRSSFNIRAEYRKEICRVDFISQSHESIEIDEVFVFPHLLPDSESNFDEIKARITNFEELLGIKRALIRGEVLSGKTTLCRKLFLHLIDNGEPVMLVDLAEAGTRRNEEAFFRTIYTKQLKGDFTKWQQRSDLTIIFDNLTSMKIPFVVHALENFTNLRNVLIATSDDEYFSYFADDDRLADFTQLRLLQLQHPQQEELIRNWRKLDPRIRSGELQLTDSNVDLLERNVNSITMNKIVPRYPFFVLSILQTHEAFMPPEFEITAYGHCYHALIVAQMLRLEIPKGEVNSCFNFLSWFAHSIRKAPGEQIEANEDDFDLFNEEYRGKFVIKDSTINRLFNNNSPILFRKDKNVGFCWSYSYYFFLGRYLAEHYLDSEEMIAGIVEKSFVRDNSLALIFVIHHSSNPKTIEDILRRTMCTFDRKQPVKLDIGEVKVFQNLMRQLPDDVSSEKSVSEERRAVRQRRDMLESGEVEFYEESPQDFINDVYRALKNMEILSQILKTKHGSIEKERLSRLIETVIDTALKLARTFLLDEDKIDRFARYVEEKFEEKEDLTNLREGVRCLIFVAVIGCIEKAASHISIEELRQIVNDLRKRKQTPAYDLIYFFFSLNVADPFSEFHRKLLDNMLKRHKENEVLKKVLSWRVQTYFNTHTLEAHAMIRKDNDVSIVKESIKQSTLDILRRHMNGSKSRRTRL